MKYNIDYKNISYKALNYIYKSAVKLVDYLGLFGSQLNYLNNIFYSKTLRFEEIVNNNNQRIIIEKLLNDKYDNTLRRIYITTNVIEPIYFYKVSESETPVYLYTKAESIPFIMSKNKDIVGVYAPDYTVHLPTSLSSIETKIKSTVDLYNRIDKLYNIIYE
jgi:hypothetical protein